MASNAKSRESNPRGLCRLCSGSRTFTRAVEPRTKPCNMLAAVLLCLFSACSTERPQEPSDELVVVLPRDAQEIDPRFTGDAYGVKVSRLLFASLMRLDPHTLEVVPDLAQELRIVDSTRYVIRLRPGLKFSDGSALDAQDVLATYRSVVSPQLGSRYAQTYRRIRAMRAIDARTVEFELDGPHATFATDLELPILRAEDETKPVFTPGGPMPVGSGPYRLLERRPGRLVFRPNPHWYRGQPHFPKLRMVAIRDDNTRALRMLAGAADLALNAIPPLLVPLFEDSDDFDIASAPGVGTTYLGMNTQAGLLQDVRVRRAIGHAIDRQLIVDTKFGGRATLAKSWIVPGHWAFDATLPDHAYDPGRARALLDAAGFRPDGAGVRLRLSLRCGSDRFRQSVARVIAAMLAEVGIAVEIRPTEVATLIADLNRGRFELTMLQVPEVVEPHVLSWFFGSQRIPGPGVEGANRWRLSSSRLDAALERGRLAHDRAQRRAAYLQVQRVLAEQLPVVPLWHEHVVAVSNRRASGYRVPRDGRFGTLAAD